MNAGRTMDQIYGTLRSAGYRIDSEEDLKLGMMAYDAAVMIKVALLLREVDGGADGAPGRNGPVLDTMRLIYRRFFG